MHLRPAVLVTAAGLVTLSAWVAQLEANAVDYRETKRVECVQDAVDNLNLEAAADCNIEWAPEWGERGDETKWRECVTTAYGGDFGYFACDALWGDQWRMTGDDE